MVCVQSQTRLPTLWFPILIDLGWALFSSAIQEPSRVRFKRLRASLCITNIVRTYSYPHTSTVSISEIKSLNIPHGAFQGFLIPFSLHLEAK